MKTRVLTGIGLLIFSLTPLFLTFGQDKIADASASLAFVVLLTVILAQVFDLFFRIRPRKGVK